MIVPNTTSESAIMKTLFPETSVTLSCTSSGVPQPVIAWDRDRILLMNGTGNVSIISYGNISELTVLDNGGQQGGEYNCTGINVAGMTSVSFLVECNLRLMFIFP